jgi:hypothetical protein
MTMQNKYAEVTPRYLNPMWASELSEEARKAVNAAFDAMSTWRIETAKNSEKNSEQVIDKMAAAARALGWPEQIIDTIRAQMQSITKMQIQTMDQMMDAWEEQIKSPNPMTGSPSAMLSKLKSSPSGSPAGSWPDAGAFQLAAANPLQFWMQFAEQWQKACADACRFGPRPASHMMTPDCAAADLMLWSDGVAGSGYTTTHAEARANP